MKQPATTRKRTKLVNLRVLPEDYDELQKLAAKKGIATSTYCYLIIKESINQVNHK